MRQIGMSRNSHSRNNQHEDESDSASNQSQSPSKTGTGTRAGGSQSSTQRDREREQSISSQSLADDLSLIEDDELAEKIHVYAPRKSGVEIAPGIGRLMAEPIPKELKYHEKYFQIFLQRHRIKNIEKHLTYLREFDHSDQIVPHGEISKKIYQNIASLRNFDAYARPLYLNEEKIKFYEEKHRMFLLGKKYRYTRPPDESEKIRKGAIPVFDEDLPVRKQNLTTAPWKIGLKSVYNPPVGFAKTPGNVLNSEGREGFYPYNGEWKDGMMEGEGEYLFSDGRKYIGSFHLNNCEGRGSTDYPTESYYEGEWKRGKFHGKGHLACSGGTEYEGDWRNGKRDGNGILELPCGLKYEGEFQEGVPHGRGRMVSKLTGYIYEGSFVKGSIEGSGTLITPPPENKRIVRYWPHSPKGMSLSGLIRLLIQERKDFYSTSAKNKEIMFAPKRKLFLNDYVTKVRTELHEQRAIEKRERLNAQIQAIKEQKEKMRQAKLQALGGDEFNNDHDSDKQKEAEAPDEDSDISDEEKE